jgi:hypothetical protein
MIACAVAMERVVSDFNVDGDFIEVHCHRSTGSDGMCAKVTLLDSQLVPAYIASADALMASTISLLVICLIRLFLQTADTGVLSSVPG